jgi:hypothetical protein
MRGPDVSFLGPAFKYSNEDDHYMGMPISDSGVFMIISAPTAVPMWPFTAIARVNTIWLEFSDSCKTPVSGVPVSSWINFLTYKLGRMPEHYYSPHPPENKLIATNEYLWIFDKYCFEIYEYTPKSPDSKKGLGFSAYLGPPHLYTEHYGIEYYKITDSWDTVKVVYDTTLRR